MNRRVIFIDETANIAGAEINLLNMIGLLAAKGWTPLVILPEPGPLVERLMAQGIAVHFVPHPPFISTTIYLNRSYPLPNPLGFLISLLAGLVWTVRLSRFLQAHPCGVVHTISTWAHASGGLAARIRNLPLAWHFQEIVSIRAGWGLYRRMVMFAARILPDRILCISNPVAEQFLEATKVQNKVVLLRNTIDIERYAQAPENMDCQNKSLDSPLNIVTVARLTPWKGQEIVLEAAQRLNERGIPFRWRLVGDESLGLPGYGQHLHSSIVRLGLSEHVHLTGWIDDMPGLYQEEDILVHIPTEPEPFGLVLAEALSAGLPVITTNHGGAAALVADAGGIVVPPGEAQPVVEALCHWWYAPEDRRRTGNMARQFAERAFSLDSYVERLTAVYAEMLEERHGW